MSKPTSSDVFRAVADPSRRRMLDAMRDREATVGELTALIGASQPAVSKHIGILRDAGLVRVRKEGRHSVCTLEPAQLTEIADWLSRYTRFWHGKLGALEAYLDATTSDADRTEGAQEANDGTASSDLLPDTLSTPRGDDA